MNRACALWWNNELTESQRRWYCEVRFRKDQIHVERVAYQAWKEHIKGQRLRIVE